MGKQIVCDICGRTGVDIKLKIKGHFTKWIPGIFSPYTEKLWLCEECHTELIKSVRKLTQTKAKEGVE